MKFKLKYPISPWTPSQGFGKNDVPLYKQLGLLGHNGIDVPCKDGTTIYAAHDGVVTFTGEDGSGGLGVVIRTTQDYEWGNDFAYFKSIYWHIKKGSFKVKPSDQVLCGTPIAEADNTGASTASHLHFGIKPIWPGENDWEYLNLAQKNGYAGAVDPQPYFTGEYAHITSTYKFTSTMRFGQSNLDITRLQTLLQTLGYFPKEQPPTGFYGNITRKAVLAFQFDLKVASFSELYTLQGTICGPKTIAALNMI
jgi:hypothetical protein